MRAAVLHTVPGALQVEDVDIDAPGRNEVLVRTVASGLCHSDLHYMTGDRPHVVPTVLGHEGAGIVEAVGSDVGGFAPGDRVVTFPVPYCGKCEFCLSGRPTLCADMLSLSRRADERPRLRLDGKPCDPHSGLGAFAEQMLVHENVIVKVPEEMPLDRAALIGCGVTAGAGAVLRTAAVQAGANVAVIGCGGIGLSAIQGARIAGASRIVAIDINDGKLERARTFGATDVINSAATDPVEEIRSMFPRAGGVDYSFEAIGLTKTYELAFQIIGRGGTATVIGITPMEAKISLTGWDFMSGKKIQGAVMGSAVIRRDLPYFVDLYLTGRLNLDDLVSHRIGLDDVNAGYETIGDGGVARSVVVFDSVA